MGCRCLARANRYHHVQLYFFFVSTFDCRHPICIHVDRLNKKQIQLLRKLLHLINLFSDLLKMKASSASLIAATRAATAASGFSNGEMKSPRRKDIDISVHISNASAPLPVDLYELHRQSQKKTSRAEAEVQKFLPTEISQEHLEEVRIAKQLIFGSRVNACRVFLQIFNRIDFRGRGFFNKNDFRRYFAGTPQGLEELWAVFSNNSMDDKYKVYKSVFVTKIQQVQRKAGQVTEDLKNRDLHDLFPASSNCLLCPNATVFSLTGVISGIIQTIFAVVAVIVGLLLVGVELSQLISTLSIIFVAASFAFSSIVRDAFSSFTFLTNCTSSVDLFAMFIGADCYWIRLARPYQVGDMVVIDGQTMRVHKIHLMNTVTYHIGTRAYCLFDESWQLVHCFSMHRWPQVRYVERSARRQNDCERNRVAGVRVHLQDPDRHRNAPLED